MTCTQCGSNSHCKCRTGCTDRTGCCTPSVPMVPAPFYQCSSPCPADHTQKIVVNQFSTTIKPENSWNVPACGETAVLTVLGLKNVATGSYIWSSEYGYFEISAFNVNTGQLTVINRCTEGNAAAGTEVDACSPFIVVGPPCECNDSSNVCVAIDFTAPAVDDCLDITLTSTQGLTAGDTVEIGSGFYFLSQIKPNDVVTICNKGDGIAPGTPVIAKDANDNYQYCLSIISVNPCDRDVIQTGAIIACSSDVVSPLTGYEDGLIPVLLDETTGEARYQPVVEVPICWGLGADLNLVNGTPSYTLQACHSGFVVGDILQITNAPGFRFTITGFPDATHIGVTCSPTPGADQTITAPQLVCVIGCCEQNENAIENITSAAASANENPHTTAAGPLVTTTVDTATQTVNLVNNSDNIMDVMFTLEFQLDISADAADGADNAQIDMRIFYDPDDVTPTTQVARHFEEVFSKLSEMPVVRRLSYSGTLQVPANSTRTLNFFGRLDTTANGVAAFYDLDMYVRHSYIAVAA